MKRAELTHTRVFSDERQAENYAKGHKVMAEKFGREYADKLSALGFQEGRIIDVGCGFGATDLVLGERFVKSEITGIDLSDPLLHLAKQGAVAAGLAGRVGFEKADVQQIPYENDTFDVVINTNMVHLVEDPLRMLNEIERVLAPGGHLFIADLRRSWLGLIETEIRSALTLEEANELFARSALRGGTFRSGLLWWRFEA
jgi:ubiquinone/menaquinone biosynthesis C-methylase UbiE